MEESFEVQQIISAPFQAMYFSLPVNSLRYFLNISPINNDNSNYYYYAFKHQSWFLLLANKEEPAKEMELDRTAGEN